MKNHFECFTAAMHVATAICTNPLGGLLSNLIGRRKSFIVLVTIGIIGYITMALSPNIPALFVGRFMTIVCASGLAPTISVHIAETVHSSMRGSFSVFHSMFNSVGILVVLGLGYCVTNWRELAWVCMVPGCLHLLVVFFLHDTPYWLVEKNAKEEAIKSLQFYRGRNFDITQEFNEIIKQKEAKDLLVNTRSKNGCCSSLRRIFSPAFGRPFMVIGIIQILNFIGVYTVLLFNMINIFKEAQSSINPQLAPVFVGIVQVGLF